MTNRQDAQEPLSPRVAEAIRTSRYNKVSANLGALVAGASLFVGGYLVVIADPPELLKADTTNQVQEDSRFDILFGSIVEQPLPQFGAVFAEIESGKWHIVKVVEGKFLGKDYEFILPATGRAVEFKNIPVKVEIAGTDFGAYTWEKGSLNPETNLHNIVITVNTDKIAHNVSFLEEGYNTKDNEDEESYIINKNDASTRLGDQYLEGPGTMAEAICSATGKVLSGEKPGWCEFFGEPSEINAIKDSKIERTGRQVALESVEKCLATVWSEEQQMIVSSIQRIIGTQLEYPESQWNKHIKVVFDKQQVPDYTKSTNDALVKQGVLTYKSLEDQGYKYANTLIVNCTTRKEAPQINPSPTAESTN